MTELRGKLFVILQLFKLCKNSYELNEIKKKKHQNYTNFDLEYLTFLEKLFEKLRKLV